jgi:hypothetical protein
LGTNRRIGSTPYFKFYCRHPRLPINQFDPINRENNKIMCFSDWLSCLERNWKSGQDRTDRYLQIENVDRVKKEISLNSVCFVYYDVAQLGFARKLSSLWVGPCLVTRVISDSLYEVQPLENCRLKDKSARIVPRDKLYLIENYVDLTPDERIDLIVTDDFFSVDSEVKINYTFPNIIRELSYSGLLEDSDCASSTNIGNQVQGFQVTKTSGEKTLGTEELNINGQTDCGDTLHNSIEDLSQRLENSHISEPSVVSSEHGHSFISEQEVSKDGDLNASNLSDTVGPTNNTLDSTMSSIGKDSVFNENYSYDNSLVGEDINMETARDLDARLSILEENHSMVQDRISNLVSESRRGSLKRARDNEEDELDRSAEGIKTQKMSDTLLVRGRPKGSTNEVQQQKLEEDRQNRDKDRQERYSNSDVLTRRLTRLLTKKD